MVAALAAGLAGCASDPGELPVACDPRQLDPGEVRVKRLACADELIGGGEGAVGDWVLENALVRFVVRDTYAALTQLGEDGGTLVDAARVGNADLLMELAPAGARSSVEAALLDGAGELRLPGVVYHLDADAERLAVTAPDGAALDAVWVPKPGAAHTDGVARSGAHFFALELAEPLPDEADTRGQVDVVGLTGVALTPAARWPDGEPLAAEVDADTVEVRLGGRLVDVVPVAGGAVASTVPAGSELVGARDGCVYAGLEPVACAELVVWVRDEADQPVAATVHFAGEDHPLPAGGGHAPLGVDPGVVWVWAGPGHAAWTGWYAGQDTTLRLTLPRVLPAEAVWPEGGGDFPEGGARLAAFGVEVAPDAEHGELSTDRLHALRAEGVGYANLVADDEFPSVVVDADDDVLVTSGSRAGGDVWSWGWGGTPRRSGHGAIDHFGFGALDRATLIRGGAGADRFVVVRPEWVTAALAEAPAWAWPVSPDALWLDSPADIPTLATLAAAWVDAQPLAERVWLPHQGVANLAVTTRALYERTASAGNGPRVDVTLLPIPGTTFVKVDTLAPGWMGPVVATLHTDAGEAPLALDEAGSAVVPLRGARWVFVSVSAPASRPWGGDPAWAVSAVSWL